jgi:hypothetical protein
LAIAHPAILDLVPAVSPLIGNVTMTLYAQRIPIDPRPQFMHLEVEDTTGWKRIREWTLTSNQSAVYSRPRDRIYGITFHSPNMSRLNYVPIKITSAGDSAETVTHSGLLYVVNIPYECQVSGRFWTGSYCISCPEGGFCPGGDRIWPIRGYWSDNERSYPQECPLPAACPGSIGELADYPPLTFPGLNAGRNTSQCAFNEGYTGILCQSCLSPGFYQQVCQRIHHFAPLLPFFIDSLACHDHNRDMHVDHVV